MEQPHGHHHGRETGRQPRRPHGHRGGHSTLWLPSRHRRPVHRIGRRQFLTDLGRNMFAIAVLGGFVAACSGDDDIAIDAEPDVAEGGTVEATTIATTTIAASPTEITTNDAPTSDPALRWAQALLGSVSAYVLVRGKEAVVVDTGNPGSADQIGVALGTLNATYDDVRHIVLTHSHPDHVGSLPAVLERSVSAAVYAGGADIPNIDSPIEVTAVGGGDDVLGLAVIDTPGHTPGSISVYDPGIGLLLAGDALNGNDDGTGLSGPNERFTADLSTANASVLELAELVPNAIGMGHGQPVESGADSLLTALAAEL